MANRRKIGQLGSKSGQNGLYASLLAFDPDSLSNPVVSLSVDVQASKQGVPMHTHVRGQIVLTLRGNVTCELESGLWLVPPDCALWIPGGTPHRSVVSADGIVCYLYLTPDAVQLPTLPCTLLITPLVRELIIHVTRLNPGYDLDSPDGRIVSVLIEQLEQLAIGELNMPLPDNSRLRAIANEMLEDPGNRNTIHEWAKFVALSERSLGRLVQKETGMTFGEWRQQFKIMVAVQDLAAGASVESVAEKLGYESTGAFTLMFKKVLGQTPRLYVNRRGNSHEAPLA